MARFILGVVPKTRKRNPNLWLLLIHPLPHGGQMKARRQNTDDGVSGAVQREGFPERLRIAMEARLKESVGEQRHMILVFDLLGRCKQMAKTRERTPSSGNRFAEAKPVST